MWTCWGSGRQSRQDQGAGVPGTSHAGTGGLGFRAEGLHRWHPETHYWLRACRSGPEPVLSLGQREPDTCPKAAPVTLPVWQPPSGWSRAHRGAHRASLGLGLQRRQGCWLHFSRGLTAGCGLPFRTSVPVDDLPDVAACGQGPHSLQLWLPEPSWDPREAVTSVRWGPIRSRKLCGFMDWWEHFLAYKARNCCPSHSSSADQTE